jgi:hypothetical protein
MHERTWPDGSPEAEPAKLHLSGIKLPAGVPAGNRLSPEYRLVAAILLQALVDAWAGDPSAVRWMDERALALAQWLELDPACLAEWRSLRRPVAFKGWDPAEFADLWEPGETAEIGESDDSSPETSTAD